MERLSHLAPEEIAGALLLAAVLVFVALRPSAVTDRFMGEPYATPVPGGGPGLQFLVERETPAPSPESILIIGRDTPGVIIFLPTRTRP
ncbi:MAG: hypothetical protein HYX56_02395 [Chloroflexi bacterium]|nr:hypothetical protein [Chloroflexota bacterium]